MDNTEFNFAVLLDTEEWAAAAELLRGGKVNGIKYADFFEALAVDAPTQLQSYVDATPANWRFLVNSALTEVILNRENPIEAVMAAVTALLKAGADPFSNDAVYFFIEFINANVERSNDLYPLLRAMIDTFDETNDDHLDHAKAALDLAITSQRVRAEEWLVEVIEEAENGLLE